MHYCTNCVYAYAIGLCFCLVSTGMGGTCQITPTTFVILKKPLVPCLSPLGRIEMCVCVCVCARAHACVCACVCARACGACLHCLCVCGACMHCLCVVSFFIYFLHHSLNIISLQYPKMCGSLRILNVRDLTVGYDSSTPDNRPVSICST